MMTVNVLTESLLNRKLSLYNRILIDTDLSKLDES